MSSLNRDRVFQFLQFLEEEKFEDTLHNLERESKVFFNIKYFEEIVTNGELDKADNYLSGFTDIDDNGHSIQIFFEIRKQKYFEALYRGDNAKAVEILQKELSVFASFKEDLVNKLTLLLSQKNFRENKDLSAYGDDKAARAKLFGKLKPFIENNPLLHDKLQFPTLNHSRLRIPVTESLNLQLQLGNNLEPNASIKPLRVDHTLGQPHGAQAPSSVTNPLMVSMPKGGLPLLGAHGPPHIRASHPSSVPHKAVSAGSTGINLPNNPDSEHILKRSRPFGLSNRANNLPVNTSLVADHSQGPAHKSYSSDDLPKTVVANLNQGSAVKSLDFHPVEQTLLLVGTSNGDIAVWEVGACERLAFRKFEVWDLGTQSMTLLASFAKEYTVWVNRVMWSPDGKLLGVAYSKHIVHLHAYHGGDDMQNHLEIDAHTGNVNDLAFSHPNKRLCIITCGEDKTVKIWDAATGSNLHTFEGHRSSVYSVCPHTRKNVQFIFSTGTDGTIMIWLYDNIGPRVDYVAPVKSCTMAYSADGSRLFLCGTTEEGVSCIAEWNESTGAAKRIYSGLGERSVGVMKFDTIKSRFLAAGDEFVIKFWDMDNCNLLETIDAGGGLPASPCIRFNKEGTLLAVSTSENGVKILANAVGVRLQHSIEGLAPEASRITSETSVKAPVIGNVGDSTSAAGTTIGVTDMIAPVMALIGDCRSVPDMMPRIMDESEESKIWKLTEITQPSQLRSLRLPDNSISVKIVRLIYTNSGGAILALAYNAVHKLWKWQRNELNSTGKATTSVCPQLWQPSTGISMINSTKEENLEDAVPCFALSKNDSYLMSASGGEISLFIMMSFKTRATFMLPPPAATSIAFNPKDNNIIAVGMEDSSVQIYNVRLDEVKSKLKGHQKRVTSLAFSNVLNVLVSSGADAQLCVWSSDEWDKQASKFLEIPSGASRRTPTPAAPTRVQFHQDQVHLLVVHETQIAIYEAPKLECYKQWVPRYSSGSITDATYSCDGRMIYASFADGAVTVLTPTTLTMRCRISPTTYLPSNPSPTVYPLVITAHPSEPNQFALGLTDGGVHVLEPLDAEGSWGYQSDT